MPLVPRNSKKRPRVDPGTSHRGSEEPDPPSNRLSSDQEPESGEDLFDEHYERDYAEIPQLDRYDEADLDDENEYAPMDFADRRAVDAALRKRDILEGRIPLEFQGEGELEEAERLDPSRRVRRRRHLARAEDAYLQDSSSEDVAPLETVEDLRGQPIPEVLEIGSNERAISQRFQQFFLTYTDNEGHSVYGARIEHLVHRNRESLDVDWAHLEQKEGLIAYMLQESPERMLDIMDNAAMQAVLTVHANFRNVKQRIHVRIVNFPTMTSIRDLRIKDADSLVRVRGVVTRRTAVFPELRLVKYDCQNCNATIGPFQQEPGKELKINLCPTCQTRGPFRLNTDATVYRNYQKLTLQETPTSVPTGTMPRSKEIIMLYDLVDQAQPGEEIEITGIYRRRYDGILNRANGHPVFQTLIEANSLSKRNSQFADDKLTDIDRDVIQRLAKTDRIADRIIKSIAPSIHGHHDVKTALALALFGGVPKNVKHKHRIRGDINILILGDPGTAKSQFLKYMEKTAPRAMYTTGQGSSGVGLTAAVRKDPMTKEWTLEGGALVLADNGVCLIDEFDKMNDVDRTSIHEAMEQQSISISKAGIVTTLKARAAVVAAANPVHTFYNSTIPFSENVRLTEPILSRFDVLAVVRDFPDPAKDVQLAKFVLQNHVRSHASADVENVDQWARKGPDAADLIPQDLLKKYVRYAKEHCHPKLQAGDYQRVTKLYSELRRESIQSGGIPITPRQVESIIRLAEAHARMHLRPFTNQSDIDIAIRVILESFISSQKTSVSRKLRRQFYRYTAYNRDRDEVLYSILNELMREKMLMDGCREIDNIRCSKGEFEKRARANGFGEEVRYFYTGGHFRSQGLRLHNGVITREL